jgi:hypothetical protein
VLLAALDQRLIEDVLNRAGQGLGPVQHRQDGLGDVQAAVPQPGDQVRHQGRVLGRAFLHRQRVLDPVDADAQRDDAGALAEVHPADHERDQVQVIQAARHQVGQRGLGRGGEPAGDRRLRRGRGRLHGLPGRLEPAGIAAGGQAREHLLHRQLAQDLGRGEQVITGQVQLPGPVRGPDPGPGHRQAPPAQRHRPPFGAVPVPGAIRVVLAARTAQRRHVLVEHRGHHLQAGAHRHSQQALLR